MHIDMSNSFKGKKDNNRLYFIYVVTNMIDMDNLLSLLASTKITLSKSNIRNFRQ